MRKTLLYLAIATSITGVLFANEKPENLQISFSESLTISTKTKRQLIHLTINNSANEKQTLSLNVPKNNKMWQVEFPSTLTIPANTKVRFPIAVEINDIETLTSHKLFADISTGDKLLKSIPITFTH